MSTLQQIYCTHCTFGTSALERKDGELANRPVGYGPRAASLHGIELRTQYRLLERFFYYHLPSDTPADIKTKWTAQEAPRRLFYNPSVNGMQLAGQICYRTFDTTGQRAGSYFGHVIYRDPKKGGEPIRALDSLRLWGSRAWTAEDSLELTHDLLPLDALSELGAGSAAISDDVLHSFASTEANGAFHDPGQVIPSRVRAWAPELRRELLQWTLAALLSIDMKRESVIVMAEPGLAALVFYGALRLLPENLSSDISFSTYDKPPDRLDERYLATLVGTRFFDSSKNVGPDFYKRLWLIGTFDERPRYERKAEKLYAARMVDLLKDSAGQLLVQERLQQYSDLKPDLADLEGLVRAEELIEKILDPNVPPANERSVPLGKHGGAYLRHSLAYRFANGRNQGELLGYVGTPVQPRLLKLLATKQFPCGAVKLLLDKLPQDQIDIVLETELGDEDKADAIARAMRVAGGALPGDLLPKLETAATQTGPLTTIFPLVLAKLRPEEIHAVWSQLAARPRARDAVLESFQRLPASANKGEVLEELLASCSDEQLRVYLSKDKGKLLTSCPAELSALASVLDGILNKLPRYADPEIWSWLTILGYARKQAPGLEKGLQAWERVQKSVAALVDAENVKEGLMGRFGGKAKEDRCLTAATALTEDLLAALKQSELVRADRREKVACLDRLVQGTLTQDAFFFKERVRNRVYGRISDEERQSEQVRALASFNSGKAPDSDRNSTRASQEQAAANADFMAVQKETAPWSKLNPKKGNVPASADDAAGPMHAFMALPGYVRWPAVAGVVVLAGLVIYQLIPPGSTQKMPPSQKSEQVAQASEKGNAGAEQQADSPKTVQSPNETKKASNDLRDSPKLGFLPLTPNPETAFLTAGQAKSFELRVQRNGIAGPLQVSLEPQVRAGSKPWVVDPARFSLAKGSDIETLTIQVKPPDDLQARGEMGLKIVVAVPEGKPQEMQYSFTAEARPGIVFLDLEDPKPTEPGGASELPIRIRRIGGFQGPVIIRLENLESSIDIEEKPAEVSNFVKPNYARRFEIARNAERTDLRFKAPTDVKDGKFPFRVQAEGQVEKGEPVTPAIRELALLIRSAYGLTEAEVAAYKKNVERYEAAKKQKASGDEVKAILNEEKTVKRKVELEQGDLNQFLYYACLVLANNKDAKTSEKISQTLLRAYEGLKELNEWPDGLQGWSLWRKALNFVRAQINSPGNHHAYERDRMLECIKLLENQEFSTLAKKVDPNATKFTVDVPGRLEKLVLSHHPEFKTKTQLVTKDLVEELRRLQR